MTEEPILELPLLKEPRVQDVLLVETSAQLTQAIETLRGATGPFALDAERASGFKYSQRAYLIQVHRKDTPIFLIDPVAVLSDDGKQAMSDLSFVLASDEWILHAASQDIPCLRELGFHPLRIFDTELGSRIAGLPRVGLGAVTEHFLKIRLAKEHSAVDWSIRPLHKDWLNYAALDVDVLIELRDGVYKLLVEQGKLDWAEQEFANVVAMQPKEPKVDRWRGMTGMHEIKDTRSLAIARELWLARESLAQKLDVSPGRLIPDSSIVGLAANPLKSRPELASSKSFSGRASRSYLDTWWAALSEGLSTKNLPPLKLQTSGIPNHRIWPNRFPEADARLKATRPVIAELSEKLSVPIENLLTPDYLRAICWQPPENISVESLSEQLSTLGARPWQIETVAEAIFTALTAEPISAEPSEAD